MEVRTTSTISSLDTATLLQGSHSWMDRLSILTSLEVLSAWHLLSTASLKMELQLRSP